MQQINDFFEKYAYALECFDTKGMAYLYSCPCTLISNENTTIFNDYGKLEGFFNQGINFYRQFGIKYALYEIWTRREWTERICHVKINWQYFDGNKKPIYNCDYHYVLKLDKNNQWKIVLSTSVNEKERMEAWQNDKQKRPLVVNK